MLIGENSVYFRHWLKAICLLEGLSEQEDLPPPPPPPKAKPKAKAFPKVSAPEITVPKVLIDRSDCETPNPEEVVVPTHRSSWTNTATKAWLNDRIQTCFNKVASQSAKINELNSRCNLFQTSIDQLAERIGKVEQDPVAPTLPPATVPIEGLTTASFKKIKDDLHWVRGQIEEKNSKIIRLNADLGKEQDRGYTQSEFGIIGRLQSRLTAVERYCGLDSQAALGQHGWSGGRQGNSGSSGRHGTSGSSSYNAGDWTRRY